MNMTKTQSQKHYQKNKSQNSKNTKTQSQKHSKKIATTRTQVPGGGRGNSVQCFFRRGKFRTGKIPHLPNLKCIESKGGSLKFWQTTSGGKHRISVPENLHSIPTSMRLATAETLAHISPLISHDHAKKQPKQVRRWLTQAQFRMGKFSHLPSKNEGEIPHQVEIPNFPRGIHPPPSHTKTQKHKHNHKNTTTKSQPQKHNHKNTLTRTQEQRRNRKHTVPKTQPQKTQSSKQKHKNTIRRRRSQKHNHKNTITRT